MMNGGGRSADELFGGGHDTLSGSGGSDMLNGGGWNRRPIWWTWK
jgi:hypothetical protein